MLDVFVVSQIRFSELCEYTKVILSFIKSICGKLAFYFNSNLNTVVKLFQFVLQISFMFQKLF